MTIWLVSLGTVLSAAFIMAANSWMQHPVGYTMVSGKPQLNDIWAVFTNPVFLWGYSWNGKVIGLSPLQSQYSKQFGPGNYVPNVFI